MRKDGLQRSLQKAYAKSQRNLVLMIFFLLPIICSMNISLTSVGSFLKEPNQCIRKLWKKERNTLNDQHNMRSKSATTPVYQIRQQGISVAGRDS